MYESNGGRIQDMRVAALKYNADEDPAPVVVAAGAGFVANKILEIADECGISIYHDDSAATLLAKLNLGQEVPPELYQMVVDIYMAVLTAAQNSKQTLAAQVGKAKETKEREFQAAMAGEENSQPVVDKPEPIQYNDTNLSTTE